MKKIEISNYDELKGTIEENEFIVDISNAISKQKERMIDFLVGLTFANGNFKKIEKDVYQVVINEH